AAAAAPVLGADGDAEDEQFRIEEVRFGSALVFTGLPAEVLLELLQGAGVGDAEAGGRVALDEAGGPARPGGPPAADGVVQAAGHGERLGSRDLNHGDTEEKRRESRQTYLSFPPSSRLPSVSPWFNPSLHGSPPAPAVPPAPAPARPGRRRRRGRCAGRR